MKKRLENMGEVNPTAIEAFTEVKARHDFIVEQKTDLVNAKDSLLATIEEVESYGQCSLQGNLRCRARKFRHGIQGPVHS